MDKSINLVVGLDNLMDILNVSYIEINENNKNNDISDDLIEVLEKII